MKTIIIAITLILVYGNTIEWSKGRKLTWDDFKGPTKDWNVAAVSYCGIELRSGKTNILTGRVTISIMAYFDSDSSFYFKDRADSNVLKHEQVHFDIAELYARKMRKELSKNALVTSKTAKEVYDRLYQEYVNFQTEYEHDTRLGTDLDAQRRFGNRVAAELKELDSFDRSAGGK